MKSIIKSSVASGEYFFHRSECVKVFFDEGRIFYVKGRVEDDAQNSTRLIGEKKC